MVCYARPASRLAAIAIVALLLFSRPVSHFFDTAALMLAVTPARLSPRRSSSRPSCPPAAAGLRPAAA